MIVQTPKVGDRIAYYAPRGREEIRTAIEATVTDVYPLTNVSFARAPAREYGNAVDLEYAEGGARHSAQRVPYTADSTDRRGDECWAWPQGGAT